MKPASGGALLVIASIVVVASIVAGIIELGPPSDERARRLDSKRTTDLQQLTSAIEYFHQQKGHLPSSLEELSSFPNVRVELRDPESGESYGYRLINETSCEVCATFDRDSNEQQVSYGREFWAHTPGRHCFTVNVRQKPAQ